MVVILEFPHPEVSVVVPVYRNVGTLREIHRRLQQVFRGLSLSYEVFFVEDACPEGSLSVLKELIQKDTRVAAMALGRNVGQNRAVLAALKHTLGKWVVVMDADLQDPPEAIPELIAKLESGYAASFGGRRGRYESPFRMLTSRLFKMLLHLMCGLPADAGLFVAMTREMVEQLMAFGEYHYSMNVMMALTGLPLAVVPVVRNSRSNGQSAYSSWGRLKYAFHTLDDVLRWRVSAGRHLYRSNVRVPVKAYIGARFAKGSEG